MKSLDGGRIPKLSSVKMRIGTDGKASVHVVATDESTRARSNGDDREQATTTNDNQTRPGSPNHPDTSKMMSPRSTQKAVGRSLKEYEARETFWVPDVKLAARKSLNALTLVRGVLLDRRQQCFEFSYFSKSRDWQTTAAHTTLNIKKRGEGELKKGFPTAVSSSCSVLGDDVHDYGVQRHMIYSSCP